MYGFDQSFYLYEHKSVKLPLAARNEKERKIEISFGQQLQSVSPSRRPRHQTNSLIYILHAKV